VGGQAIRLGDGQAIHHSGGLGAMGFSLPTAIGIAVASRTKTVVIAGDGGMQINIQELDTIKRMALDFLIVVLNNQSLGMVKNFQDLYFDGRDRSTRIGYSAPSFANVAAAYGISSVSVTSQDSISSAFSNAVSAKGPQLIEVIMEGATECRPRVSFGNKLDEPSPQDL
jgi:acetolactate synthase I/II/III large subunit